MSAILTLSSLQSPSISKDQFTAEGEELGQPETSVTFLYSSNKGPICWAFTGPQIAALEVWQVSTEKSTDPTAQLVTKEITLFARLYVHYVWPSS